MYEEEIARKIKELPDRTKKEVLVYLNSLLAKERMTPEQSKGFDFSWENIINATNNATETGLSSVDLQHKSMEWR